MSRTGRTGAGGRRWALAISIAVALPAVGAAPAGAQPAVALLGGNTLIRFDTATPGTIQSSTAVTGLGAGQTLRGIDVRPATGGLYGIAATTGTSTNAALFLYTIDPATAVAAAVGQTDPIATAGDVPSGTDFNPVADRIRVVNTNDANLRLNPDTGALISADSSLSPAGTTDIVGAAYDRNTAGTPATTLFEIDRNTSTLSAQGGPNGTPSANGGVVTDIGPLGVTLTAGTDAGFDISPTGTGFAALTTGGGGVTSLYTINPGFGSGATLVGTLGAGPGQVYSLAVLPTDTDGDGVPDAGDKCPSVANADQADLDGDGLGDPCDSDQDGDGLSDAVEAAIGSDPRSTNSDGDAVGDAGDACPTLTGTTPNGCPDIALPDTSITKTPERKTTKRRATLEFISNEAGTTFTCSLDHKPFTPCVSPATFKRLKVGRHFVDVRAIDSANNLDPTPATAAWRVKPKPEH